MKRDFLEEMGLSKEQIDAIMSEHGRNLEELKARNTVLEGIASDREKLNDEKVRLEKELCDERTAHSSFRAEIISELVAEARPSSALAKAELIRRLEECSSSGLRQALNDIRVSDPDAFQNEADRPIFSAFSSSEEAPSPISFVRRR